MPSTPRFQLSVDCTNTKNIISITWNVVVDDAAFNAADVANMNAAIDAFWNAKPASFKYYGYSAQRAV